MMMMMMMMMMMAKMKMRLVRVMLLRMMRMMPITVNQDIEFQSVFVSLTFPGNIGSKSH